jgi:hypothetical protein
VNELSEHSILGKLRKILENDFSEEYHVFYVMVEVRKYIDLTKQEGSYRYLNFYADWAVHPTMDRAMAQSFVEAVNEMMGAPFTDGGGIGESPALCALLNFERLRGELLEFLTRERLPIKVCDQDQNWERFLELYLRIVDECPMVLRLKRPRGKYGLLEADPKKAVNKIAIKMEGVGKGEILVRPGVYRDRLQLRWMFYKDEVPLLAYYSSPENKQPVRLELPGVDLWSK